MIKEPKGDRESMCVESEGLLHINILIKKRNIKHPNWIFLSFNISLACLLFKQGGWDSGLIYNLPG
jgi:hypothetical protein